MTGRGIGLAALGALCMGLAAGAASADLPAALLADAQDSAAVCREVGGTPRFQGAEVPGAGVTAEVHAPYATAADLNGDGQTDYVTDLAGLECENAWSIFCGSAGCPVRVWLSGPGGLELAWGGHAQAWQLVGQAVVLTLHGQMCNPPRTGYDGCEMVLRFEGSGDAASDAEPAAAAPAAPALPAFPTGAPPAAPGAWTYGRTADGQGMFAGVVDPTTGGRLDWLCAPGRGSLLAVTPVDGPGGLVFDVDGRQEEATPQVEGGTAYLPIAFTAPLFAHIASGMEFTVATADGRQIGRFSIITGTGAVGVAEGLCQAMR